MTAIWTTPAAMTDGYLMNASYWNQYIRDNMEWLGARGLTPTSDLDGTVGNTTSSSFTDMGSSYALTTAKANAMVALVCFVNATIGSSADVYNLTLDLDGVNQGDSSRGIAVLTSATNSQLGTTLLVVKQVAAAGAHTLKLQAKRSSGTTAAITITGMHLFGWELA